MFLKKFLFIILVFFINSKISEAQQVISSNTSSTVTATGGDITINSGVTISPGNAAGLNISSVLVNNITNNGTFDVGNAPSINFTSTSSSATITNNGYLYAKNGLQINSPVRIINNLEMQSSDRAITFNSGSTGSSVVANSNINGNYSGIRINSGVTLDSITVASGQRIGGGTVMAIENMGTITNLTNNGEIYSGRYNGCCGGVKVGSNALTMFNGSVITNLVNRGTIYGSSNMYGIGGYDTYIITNLSNLQQTLRTQYLPTNYNIIIDSSSSYGKFNVATPGSSIMTFGIYSGSVVSAGTTYQDVLTGISASNLSSLTGTYGTYTWTLASDGVNYDLTIAPSRSAYNQSVTSTKLTSVATQLETIRTNGTKTTLTNTLDSLTSVQLESALKKIQGTSITKTAAQPIQAQSNFKTALSTVTSPGSSSTMTNLTKTNQGNLTFADLQTNNLYAKIQPANYSDDSTFFDYKNNQTPVNALEFFKSNRNLNLVEKDDLKDSGFFLRTFGSVTNYAALNSDDNSYGSDSYGLLGGFQHKVDENLYQGYSLGFSKSKLTLDAGEGNTKTNTIHVSIYRKMDEKEYGATATLGGYVSFIDNIRNISETNEILKSSPTNGGLDFSVQYVKKMELLGLNFYPSASLTTTYGIVKNYSETGGSGSALEIKSHNVLAIKPEIGFTLENNFVQTDKVVEGANFSLFANRQQYLDGHTNTSSMIGENSWSASTLPKTKDDFLTAGIGYVAKNIDEKSDLNFNFFYTQSTNNSLNSSLFSISYNKTF
jgi:hypothetical protein